jgi:hypothetical protein
MTTKPKDYPTHSTVRCDLCKTSPLEQQEWFHHCVECKFDLCISCENVRYQKRDELKDEIKYFVEAFQKQDLKCTNNHQMVRLYEKPSENPSSIKCVKCERIDIDKDMHYSQCV